MQESEEDLTSVILHGIGSPATVLVRVRLSWVPVVAGTYDITFFDKCIFRQNVSHRPTGSVHVIPEFLCATTMRISNSTSIIM